MKTKLFSLCLLASTFGKAQINLENSYPATAQSLVFEVVDLVKYGYKYQITDIKNTTVRLYNLNHSIFKTIPLSIPAGHNFYFYPTVSDSLFNTDNLVEVMYSTYLYNFTVTPAIAYYEVKVVNESGTTLLNLPDAVNPQVAFTGTANGYKLIVQRDTANKGSAKSIEVYSLAGGLPVHSPCADGPANPTSIQAVNGTSTGFSSPIPNPSGNKTVIAYQLAPGVATSEMIIYNIAGKELKRYQVDGNFQTLELDNTDLPSGTYFYNMTGSQEAKKMVIIK